MLWNGYLASECDETACKVLMRNFPHLNLFRNVRTRQFPDVRLSCYVAGPPCQPWAPGGRKEGEQDSRAGLFLESMRFIACNLPLTFVLENAEAQSFHDSGTFIEDVVRHLESCGYTITVMRTSAAYHGQPHNRRRTYIVGTWSEAAQAFVRPPHKEAQPLAGFLEPRSEHDDPAREPLSGAGIIAVRAAKLHHTFDTIGEAEWIVNTHHSAAWSARCIPSIVMPSLTRNGGGPWLGSRGRVLMLVEAQRILGILPGMRILWPEREPASWRLLGNSMCAATLGRVFQALQETRGLRLESPWDGPAPNFQEDAQTSRVSGPIGRFLAHPLALQEGYLP